MTPEQWHEIKPILQAALDVAPADRLVYLESVQPRLRTEVESLIDSYEKSDSLLEQPALGAPVVSDPSATGGLVGKRFGPYRVLSLLVHGGMGSVWMAERVDGLFTRHVALKLIHLRLIGRASTNGRC